MHWKHVYFLVKSMVLVSVVKWDNDFFWLFHFQKCVFRDNSGHKIMFQKNKKVKSRVRIVEKCQLFLEKSSLNAVQNTSDKLTNKK